MSKKPKIDELEQQIADLTVDLQRTRADFENYRKRSDQEREMARASGKVSAISQLLPVVDNIERAIGHLPEDLKDHAWAQGVVSLGKKLDKSLEALSISRIDAQPGQTFNPEFHEAVHMDDSDGEHEVIAEELQAGYP